MKAKHEIQPEDVLEQATRVLRAAPIPPGPPEHVRQAVLAASQEAQVVIRPISLKERLRAMNRFIKFAAAAVLVVAVGLVAYLLVGPHGPTSIAFADVRKQIQNAQTVVSTITVTGTLPGTEKPVVSKVEVLEPGHVRQTMPDGSVSITDWSMGKTMTYNPAAKKAYTLTMGGLPKQRAQGQGNFVEQLKKTAMTGAAEELGEKEIAGRPAKGFRVRNEMGAWTIWADARTAAPVQVQVDMNMGQLGQMTAVMSDFVFNQPLDEALFSLTPPEGYAHKELKMDFSNPSENDVVETLRLAAADNDGMFPDKVMSLEMLMKMTKKMFKGAENTQEPSPEMLDLSATWARAALFLRQNQCNYDGKGVKLDEKDKPILWYVPKDSTTGRVVYGDLSAQDVELDKMPTSRPAAEPGTRPVETPRADAPQAEPADQKTESPPQAEEE